MGNGGREPAGGESGFERMLTELLEASHLAVFEQLPHLIDEHARRAGVGDVQIYLVDLQQNVLRPVTGPAPEGADDAAAEIRVDGTLGGRAFQQARILTSPRSGENEAEYWWVPLLDGTERLGVMRVHTSGHAGPQEIDRMRHLASLAALMLVSVRPYSDSYARLVRTRRMNVAAEMQWNLLPPPMFASDRVAIGVVMEPAYEIGGDAFDYAVSGDDVHTSIFDAMGHDAASGLAANLAMASSRNQRRHGVPLAEAGRGIETALLQEFGSSNRFVTAIMADLNTSTGALTWVNHGHHPPILIRGGRWVTRLQCPPSHPMGMDLDLPVTVCTEHLEPGDRLLLYTDGITEARDHHGHEFGLDRFIDFVLRHIADGVSISETLRRLIRTLLAHHDQPLQDDATVLLLEWRGSSPATDLVEISRKS
ncbi:PP2C family protein-serine/threonine phosphatase [Actinocorallia aurantiaca]|uniref:PP2C family protein-serine/threonine phosphatase n=1 Tax=Actinocorallia aurantiaca TaxID=46204 RepID=A0ABN3UFB1_9ACTN